MPKITYFSKNKEQDYMDKTVDKVRAEVGPEVLGDHVNKLIHELSVMNTRKKAIEADLESVKPEVKEKLDKLIAPGMDNVTKVLHISLDASKKVEVMLEKQGEEKEAIDYKKLVALLTQQCAELDGFNDILLAAEQKCKTVSKPRERAIKFSNSLDETITQEGFEKLRGALQSMLLWFKGKFTDYTALKLKRIQIITKALDLTMQGY